MNKAFRFFIISAAIFGVLIVIINLFDTSSLNNYLLNSITQNISSPGVVLTGNGLSLMLLGVRIASLKITLMKLFLHITFEKLSADCLSTSLFWGAPRCAFHSDLYGGSLDSDLTASTSGTVVHTAILQNVTLSQHPQVMAMGIKGGVVNASMHEMALSQNGGLPQKASWQIKNLALSKPITLAPQWTGIPLPIVLPAFIIETMSGELSEGKIRAIDVRSNLGALTGQVALSAKREFSLEIALSEKGLEELRVPLSLICPDEVLRSGGKLSLTGSSDQVHCNATS